MCPYALYLGLPHQLVRFLKTKTLMKSGVNIRGDGRKLARDFRVECNAFVDLDRISAFLYPQKTPRSLRALTGYFVSRIHLEDCIHLIRYL